MDDRRPDPSGPRWGRRLGLGVLLFAVACAKFLLDGSAPPGELRIDEGEWISSGIHAWQLATTGESVDEGATPDERLAARQSPWRLGVESSTFGWMNPILPKLLFGAAADLSGLDRTTRHAYLRFQTGNSRYLAARRVHERFAPALPATRFVVVLAAAAAAVLLFAIGARSAGLAGGAAAYLLWLASPNVSEMADWVRTGLFPLAFGLAALWLVLERGRELTGRRGLPALVLWALALGLLCGAAVGSKLNGALVSFAVPPWLLATWRSGPSAGRPPAWKPLAALTVIGALCAVLFRLSLPGLWELKPAAGVRRLLDAWRGSFETMARGANHEAVPDGILARLAQVGRRFFFEIEPFAEWTGLALGAVLVPAALLVVALRARAGDLAARLVLIHATVLTVGTIAWLPIDSRRFYYPLLVVVVLLYAIALGALLDRRRSAVAERLEAA